MNILRALLYVVGAALILLILYILVLALAALAVDPGKEYSRNSRFYRALLNSGAWLAMRICRVKLTVEGAGLVPQNGRFLFVCNHRSKFDPIVSWYALKKYDVAFLSKRENFSIPFFGRIIRRCCFMEIDRENARSSLITLEKSAELMKADEVSIGIYPEGTRSRDMTLLPFHNGIFKAAQRAGVPVVVAAISGTEKIAGRAPWRKSEITLSFIEVIDAGFVRENRTGKIGERVRADISERLGRLDRP